MDKTIMIKVGSQYVTSDGTLSPSQSDALRVTVPQSHDPNVDSPSARIVRLKTRS